MRLLAMYLRRLRTERAPSVAFVLLVGVTAFAAAVGPRLLARTADEALRSAVIAAEPGRANIELVEEQRIETGDPLAAVAERGADHEAAIPPALRSLFADRYFAIDTAFWAVLTETPEASTIFLRIQPGAHSHLTYRTGRPPTDAVRTAVFPETDAAGPISVLEGALAAPSAEALDVAVGDTVVLGRDRTDPLSAAVVAPMAVEIVGTYEVLDPADRYWSGDTEMAASWIRSVSDDVEFRSAIVLLSPDADAALLEATAGGHPPLRYRWRYLVDPERVEAEAADQIAADMRRMEGLFPATATSSPIRGTLLRSGLLALVELQQAKWRSVEAVLAVVAVGVAAVAVLALTLVAILGVRRRGVSVATWIARGATTTQLAGATIGETMLLAVPVVAVGVLAALALVGGEDTLGLILAAVVGIGAVVLVVTAVARAAGSRAAEHGVRIVRGPGGRRLVVEAAVVVLAIGGAVLLRERGISASSSTGAVQTADPLIAAVPALAGLAAGVIAVRLVPILMRLLAATTALRRDLVPTLGLRRATREGTTAAVLVVLMLTSTIASFALATFAHVTTAGAAAAWLEVGAAFRVTSTTGSVSDWLDPSTLPGVMASARAYRTPVATRGIRGFELLAIDLPRYEAVVTGTPLDVQLPGELMGDASSPLPAIVSSALVADVNGVRLGDVFGVAIRGQTVELRAVAVSDTFPTLPVGGRFVVISLAQLEALDPESRPPSSALLLRAPDDAAPALREAITAAGASLRLASRAEGTAQFRASPAIASVISGLLVAMAVTAAYAALAIASSLAMASAARAAESAHLRALGLTRMQTLGLVIAEHGSTIVVGFVAGTLLGLWLFSVLQPGLGLAALIGSTLSVPLSIDVAWIGLILAAMVLIAAIGIGLSAALERASAPASALREGIE
jgi:putative ABC transport system permease protein